MCGFNSSRSLLIKDLMITRNADAQAHRGSTSSSESNVVEQVVVIQGTRVSRLAKKSEQTKGRVQKTEKVKQKRKVTKR